MGLIDIVQGSAESIGISTVYLYGINYNSQGSTLYKNATATDEHSRTVTNMIIANYDSADGDSGAPIIHVKNNTNHLVGIHRGTTCHFDSFTEARDWQFHYNDHPTLCGLDKTEHGVNYFKVFTPWETVKNELQLQ